MADLIDVDVTTLPHSGWDNDEIQRPEPTVGNEVQRRTRPDGAVDEFIERLSRRPDMDEILRAWSK